MRRYWFDIVVIDYDAESETKVREGEVLARSRKEADAKVARMCKEGQAFNTYLIPK